MKAATLINAAFTYKMPKYHEVRFAENLLKLVRAVQSNLPSMRRHWRDLDNPDSEKREKHKVSGFWKAWGRNSLNERMTALMTDILRQFETLQKEAQLSLITFLDLLVKREQVLAHLDMMKMKPFPGGKEEDLRSNAESELLVVDKSKTPNKLVTKPDRAFEAIRSELILTVYNFYMSACMMNRTKASRIF